MHNLQSEILDGLNEFLERLGILIALPVVGVVIIFAYWLFWTGNNSMTYQSIPIANATTNQTIAWSQWQQ